MRKAIRCEQSNHVISRLAPSARFALVDPSIDESDDDAHGDRFMWDATGKHGDSVEDYEGDE